MRIIIALLIPLLSITQVSAKSLDDQLLATKEKLRKEAVLLEEMLNRTKGLKIKIGDESMTERDVLEASVSHMNLSIEYIDFYLKHTKLPVKMDAVGQEYR